MSVDNFYEILGLSRREANAESIRRAYRHQALKWHPDKCNDPLRKPEFTERFKAISEAYEILSDPETKDKYDWHHKSVYEDEDENEDEDEDEQGRPRRGFGIPGSRVAEVPNKEKQRRRVGQRSGSRKGGDPFGLGFYDKSLHNRDPFPFREFLDRESLDPFEMFQTEFGNQNPFNHMENIRIHHPAMDNEEMIRMAVEKSLQEYQGNVQPRHNPAMEEEMIQKAVQESLREQQDNIQPRDVNDDQALLDALGASMEELDLQEAIAISKQTAAADSLTESDVQEVETSSHGIMGPLQQTPNVSTAVQGTDLLYDLGAQSKLSSSNLRGALVEYLIPALFALAFFMGVLIGFKKLRNFQKPTRDLEITF